MKDRRWPVGPLWEFVESAWSASPNDPDRFNREFSVGALALATRVSPRAVHRWLRRDLTDKSADRAAIALGVHPTAIWPDWCHIRDEENNA